MPDRKPHIYIVTQDLTNAGGVLTLTSNMYNIHRAWGFEPKLVFFSLVPRKRPWSKRLRFQPFSKTVDGLPCIVLPRVSVRFGVPQNVLSFMLNRPKFGKVDAWIIVGGASAVGLPLALAREKYVLRVATTLHDELDLLARNGDVRARKKLSGPGWAFWSWQERLVYQQAASVLALPWTSGQLMNEFPETLGKIKSMLVPIDTQRFRPAEKLVDKQYLLFTGRINDPRKNISMLLRAFKQVSERRPHLTLVLVGDRPSDQLQQLVGELGLGQRVIFPGRVTLDDLISYYQQTDLFVVPSLQEGICISMLEAMACGIPVVATQCGGPEPVLVNGHTGLLVPNNDATAFAQAVLGLLDAPALREQMSQNCVEYVHSNCSRPLIEQQLRQALATVFPQVYG